MTKSSFSSSRSRHSLLLPDSLAWLDQVTMEVAATVNLKRDVRYILIVKHKTSDAQWSFSRSFDEYRQFQQKLLKHLHQGHFCQAECPWLFTFVTSYFPKSCFLRSANTCVVQRRREELERYITTIQKFLLNRNNHTCTVLMRGVVDEVLAFVCDPSQSPIKRDSMDSLLSTSDEEDTSSNGSFVASEDVGCMICGLASDDYGNHRHYMTKLRCGHRFHDECILLKLNESMNCPTCGHSEME